MRYDDKDSTLAALASLSFIAWSIYVLGCFGYGVWHSIKWLTHLA